MKKAFIVTFCFIISTSCSYQQKQKLPPEENTLNIGEKFRITLPENHKDGFMWQINNKYNTKIVDYYGSVYRGKEKGVDFNFETIGKGKDTLTFALIMYKDTAEVKQFIIDVK